MTSVETLRDGPLTGLRVLEVGIALAGPFACSLLADLGAEVIKVERIGGDDQRLAGFRLKGIGLWQTVTGRNKKSICLDLKSEDGRAVLRDLVAVSDVLVENFRPGVLERMGLSSKTLTEINDQLVLLRVSGFGQTGPYSSRRGFGKIGEAFSGATNLTGEAGGDPMHPGYSLADTVTGLMGAFGVVSALRSRDAGAGGQVVDLALYEGLLRMIEWQLPYVGLLDFNASRNGMEFPFTVGSNLIWVWPSLDHHYITITAAGIETQQRIVALLQRKGAWLGDIDNEDPIDIPAVATAIREWIASTNAEEALRELDAADIIAGMVYDPATILVDPHMRARESVIEVEHPELGSIPMPGIVPKLEKTPGRVRTPAPSVGEHTEEILTQLLNYDQDRVRALTASGVVQTGKLGSSVAVSGT
jgi:crotonobetainyl-CoA:carnitine CoA-transferase CaiB-like acyl-CoA transferase